MLNDLKKSLPVNHANSLTQCRNNKCSKKGLVYQTRDDNYGIKESSTHLNHTFSGKDVWLDFGQEHQAKEECGVRFGPIDLELFHGTTEHPLDAVIIALSLRSLNLIQKNGRGNYKRQKNRLIIYFAEIS